MTTNAQRPTRQALIVQCLTNRLWEASPEAIAQILYKLSGDALEELAATTVQVLEMGGSDETKN